MADAQAIADMIQAIIAAANAAGAAAAQNAVPPAPPAADPAPFALLPGLANADVALDFNKGNDIKLFNRAIEGNPTKFDLQEDNLMVFLEYIKERSRIYNWSHVTTVPDEEGTEYDVLESYGLVTLEACQAHAEQYINLQTRQAQNSMMMYQYIINSLTDQAKVVVFASPDQYTIDGQPSGICLLKAIIGKSTIDTIATIDLLQNSLQNLEQKMSELKSNIKEFNLYVTQKRSALIARGQPPTELKRQLFKAYLKCGDEEFIRFINMKKDQYEEGEPITEDELMAKALAKYELKVENKTWNVADAHKECIIALEAQVKLLKQGAPPTSNARATKVGGATALDPFAWKKVKPKTGEAQSKTHNKKKYHWCDKHQLWSIHTPEQCFLKDTATTVTIESWIIAVLQDAVLGTLVSLGRSWCKYLITIMLLQVLVTVWCLCIPPVPEPDPTYIPKRFKESSLLSKYMSSQWYRACQYLSTSTNLFINHKCKPNGRRFRSLCGINLSANNHPIIARSNRPFKLRHVRSNGKRSLLLLSLLASGTAHSRVSYTSNDLEGVFSKNTCCGSMVPDDNADYNNMVFDADSFEIKIDNCSTRSMSGSLSDFVPGSTTALQNTVVESYGGSTTPITHSGTIKWDISDDDGIPHSIYIPNSFYVPGSDTRLLSPQHFAQQA